MTQGALSETEVDRLVELAHVGASWAATALAQLVDTTILTRVPVAHGPERFRVRSAWTTGIFCDLEGVMAGTVGIFFSDEGRQSLLSKLCGSPDLPLEHVASALCEVGNILSSQTATAMAQLAGGVILPGLPELVQDKAESVFAARFAPRNAMPRPLYIESELFDRSGIFRALHVVVPEVAKVDYAVKR
jgi:chemotaxis protein CheC